MGGIVLKEGLEKQSLVAAETISIKIDSIEEVAVHFNTAFTFFFVLSGYLEVIKNDTCVLVRSGDVYLLNEGELVSFLGSEKNVVLTISMHLNTYNQQGYFFRLDRPLSLVYKRDAYEEFTRCLAELFIENDYQREGYRYIIEGNTQYLIGLLFRYINVSSIEQGKVASKENSKVEEITAYIHEHYTESLSLDDIADHFFLNKYYLSHTFKGQMNLSIGAYLKELRLFYSVRMLNNTNEKIVTIALNNGFPSLRAFNKAFKEKFDTSPLLFRKKRISEVTTDNKIGSKQDAFQLLAPYVHGKDFLEQNNVRQEVTIDTTKEVTTQGSIRYVLKAKPDNMSQNLALVKTKLGIQYVSVTNIFEKISIEDKDNERIIDFHILDIFLQNIVDQYMTPYIQIQMTDYDFWIEKKNLSQELFHEVMVSLKYHLLNQFGSFPEWIIEFRCFYEQESNVRVCLPLAKEIDVFLDFDNLVLHFPVTPKTALSYKDPKTDCIYCIDDYMVVKKLPISAIHESLQDDYFLAVIRESKNRQIQMQLLEKVLFLEKDDYFATYFDLSLANLTIWQFITQRVDGEQYFTPLSLDAEKVFEYFPDELAKKIALLTEQGLIKENWYAYEFLNRLHEDVLFRNDFFVVTKSRENYCILGAYPEEELVSFFHKKEQLEVAGSVRSAQSPFITVDLKLLNLKGKYKMIKQELTPEVIDRRNDWFQMRNCQLLSKEDVTFYNEVAKPSRRIEMIDINGLVDLKLELPLFGIVMIELKKIR